MAYVIRTPENVTFEFELAGIGARALAWAIDVLVMLALIVAGSMLVSPLSQVLGGFANAILLVIVFLVQWWYAALLEWWWGGRTVGKRVVGLRTLSERGVRMGFVQSAIRNLVRIVDLLPGLYLVGGASVILDRHRRRLGDLAAGTIVVRERRAPAPSSVVPPSERYNTFVDDPSVALAVRRITPPERDAMVQLSLRRERLPLSVRRELFAELAAHLEDRLGVPRPSFFSEEKYVLNLTAVALGQRSR
ncbi:MAG TPA: RDD family protein [Sandaracinaceae bacterium LLY-WYZ-13_1]|nr:RDD family protein [Sandaracinaceae bacterium LLY-WYZ-13_1]